MTEKYPICPIWHEECPPACMMRKDVPSELSHPSLNVKKCLQAGVFAYEHLRFVQDMTADLDENAKVRLCADIARQNVVYKNPPTLDRTLIRKIESQSTPLMPKRLDLALEWLVHHSPKIDSTPLLDIKKIPSFLAFSYCHGKTDNERMYVDVGEAAKIIQALAKEGFVEMITYSSPDYPLPQVTHKGYARYQELKKKSVNSSLAFVAMWFNESMDPLREAIKAGIEAAGYVPKFVDTDGSAVNRIEDEIIALIRQSRFVVADFTASATPIKSDDEANARGGVYYEAGFAHGLGRPVFFTCRKDYIDTPKALHFDTSHFLHLDWEDNKLGEGGKFQEELRRRIIAVVGKGPESPKKKKGEDAAAGN